MDWDKLTTLLDAPLSSSNVKSRTQGRASVRYIESWHAISEANRLFGYEGWSFHVNVLQCVLDEACTIGNSPGYPGWNVTYTAVVEVMVQNIIRQDVGAGSGIDRNRGLAHESAIKEAVSDAQKRALRTFGNQFGLALYDKSGANVEDDVTQVKVEPVTPVKVEPDNWEPGGKAYEDGVAAALEDIKVSKGVPELLQRWQKHSRMCYGNDKRVEKARHDKKIELGILAQ